MSGFNNLSYTVHLRQEYVVAPMVLEILRVFFYDVRCSSFAFFRLERSLLRWRRTAVRRRFMCLHFTIVLMFVESQWVHIQRTYKVSNKTWSVVLLNKKDIYSYLKCFMYDKLLKPRKSFRITLYTAEQVKLLWVIMKTRTELLSGKL